MPFLQCVSPLLLSSPVISPAACQNLGFTDAKTGRCICNRINGKPTATGAACDTCVPNKDKTNFCLTGEPTLSHSAVMLAMMGFPPW